MLQDHKRWRELVQGYAALRRLDGDMTRQVRGQRFNHMIAELLGSFGISAKVNVRSTGEVDVAFAVDSVRFILEAKWEAEPAPAHSGDNLRGHVSRRAGVRGAFLSMEGYTADALAAAAQDPRHLILLDRTHWEAMLSGLVPPAELLRRSLDAAAYKTDAFFSLESLLKHSADLPDVEFRGPVGASESILISSAEHVSAEIVLSGLPVDIEVAMAPRKRLLVRTIDGILQVTPGRKHRKWLVQLEGCNSGPCPQGDGSFRFGRAHGIGLYRDGEMRAISSGAFAHNGGQLLTDSDGITWCFDPSAAAHGNAPAPVLIRPGEELGDETWQDVPYPKGMAYGMAWLSPDRYVVRGDGDRRLKIIPTDDPSAPTDPSDDPAAQQAAERRQFLIASGDGNATLSLMDEPNRPGMDIARFQGFYGFPRQPIPYVPGTMYLTPRYQGTDGRDYGVVVRVELPALERLGVR